MDIISFNEAATANSRIEKFNANPDSTSGVVTTPKVIAAGETITIPTGRMAVLPNLQIDGTLDIQGDVFIPSGSTFGDLESQIALKAPLASPAFTGTPTAPTQTASDNSTKLATTAYVDGKFTRGTAVAASGTSIDFTGIPSWVKKITVMIDSVSTNGASIPQIQIGSVAIQTSGYAGVGATCLSGNVPLNINSTTGFMIGADGNATYIRQGIATLVNISGNKWCFSYLGGMSHASYFLLGSGVATLSGELDRIRITTVNGTDTFDAGTINILYEG